MDDKKLSKSAQEQRLEALATEGDSQKPIPRESLNGNGIADRKMDGVLGRESSSSIDRKLRMASGLSERMLSEDASNSTRYSSSILKAAESLNQSRLSRQVSQLDALSADNRGASAASEDRLGYGAQDVASSKVNTDLNRTVRRLLRVQTESGAANVVATRSSTEALVNVHNFQRGPQLRYMTNSLSASYQQVYLQRELLRKLEQVGGTVEAKLEAIKLNTAASEIKKRTTFELARDTIIRNVVSSVGERSKEKFLDMFGPWLMENMVQPARDLGGAWAESDARGAETFRKVRDAAQGASEKIAEKRQQFQDNLTATNEAPKTREELKAEANERLQKIRTRTNEALGDARNQLRKGVGTVRDAMTSGVGSAREFVGRTADDVQDLYADERARLAFIRKDAEAKWLNRFKRKSTEEYVIPQEATSGETTDYNAKTSEALKDPVYTEIKDFHMSFNDYAGTLQAKADRVLDALALIAQNGMGGGSGEGGGSNGEPMTDEERQGFFSRIRGIGSTTLSDMVRMPFRAGRALGRGYGRIARGIGRATGSALGFMNPFRKRATEPFVDVYRKGEVHIGRPLVTARRLRAGVVFDDNEPVGDVADIDRPVLDPTTMEVLITQEDVEAGLVDVHGTPLNKRGATTTPLGMLTGLLGGGIRGVGGITKTFFSSNNPLFEMYGQLFKSISSVVGGVGNLIGKSMAGALGAGATLGKGALKLAAPLMDMYNKMFGVGMDVISGGMKGAGRVLGRVFGIDTGGGKGVASRKDLDEIIGERLDDIYELLLDRLHKGGSVLDSDGDGDRDGSYADYKQRLDARRRKRAEDAAADQASGTAKKTGLMGSLAAALGLSNRNKSDDEEDDEEGGDGLLSTLATTAAGAWAATKATAAKSTLGKVLTRVPGLKKVGAKMAGGAAAATATATASKVATKAASKSAAKSAAKIGTKSLGKSILKKVPLLGAALGAGFAISRAVDGDYIGAGGELASGLLSIIPGIGTAASVGVDMWLAYRDFNADSPQGEFLRARMRYYGIEGANADQSKAIIMLENALAPLVTGNGRATLNAGHIREVASLFGFDPDDDSQIDYLISWANHRLTRVYGAYIQALGEMGLSLEDVSNLDEETASKLLSIFERKAAPISSQFEDFRPNLTTYRQMVLQEPVTDEIQSTGEGDSARPRQQAISRIESRRRHMRRTSGAVGSTASISTSVAFDEEGKVFNDYRFRAYGVTTREQREGIIKVERTLLRNDSFKRYVDQNLDTMTTIYNGKLASLFGVDTSSSEAKSKFSDWMTHRLAPVLRMWVETAKEYGVDYTSVLMLKGDQASAFIDDFIGLVNEQLHIFGALTPYADEREPDMLLEGSEALRDTSSGSNVSPVESQTNLGRAAPPINNRLSVSTNTASADMARNAHAGPAGAQTHAYTQKATANDNNRMASAQAHEGLGSLSAHYESAAAGSMAIGYDKTGGTSYGKYQIASKTGTFGRFLSWLYAKGGDARYVAERLMAAGSADTGSRQGGVPDEWRRIVSEGLMGDYEHEFIKATHYDKALHNLSADLKDRVLGSPALQDTLWSTAVQHGPTAAATLFTRAAAQDSDKETLIRKLYEERGTQFGRSSASVQASVLERFAGESRRAIQMAKSEPAEDAVMLASAESGSSAKPEGMESMMAPLDPKGLEDLAKQGQGVQNAKAVDTKSAAAVQKPTNAKQELDVAEVGTPSSGSTKKPSSKSDTPDARLEAALAGITRDELQDIMQNSSAQSIAELSKVNENLGTLISQLVHGLGEEGAMVKLQSKIADISSRPVVATIPVNAGNGNSSQNSSRDRLARVDLNLSRKGNDSRRYG